MSLSIDSDRVAAAVQSFRGRTFGLLRWLGHVGFAERVGVGAPAIRMARLSAARSLGPD